MKSEYWLPEKGTQQPMYTVPFMHMLPHDQGVIGSIHNITPSMVYTPQQVKAMIFRAIKNYNKQQETTQ